MENKFNIGDFVFWYSGGEIIGYGVINKILFDEDGYSYKVFDENEMGDYHNQWHNEKSLYSLMQEFEFIANKYRSDTEEWINACRERLEERLKEKKDK